MTLTTARKEVFGKTTGLKRKNGKLKKFNFVIDAINYLGKDNWKLVNAFPVSSGNGMIYHYVFKKYFPINETG